MNHLNMLRETSSGSECTKPSIIIPAAKGKGGSDCEAIYRELFCFQLQRFRLLLEWFT